MKRIVSVGLLLVMMVSVAGCGVKKYGELYSLQEAYDNGYITQEDLLSIAYYHNGGRKWNEDVMSENFKPNFLTPETLDKQIEQKIKQTYVYYFQTEWDCPKAKVEDISIDYYYGNYNSCYAFIESDVHSNYMQWERMIVVESVNFFYGYENSIKIWKESK